MLDRPSALKLLNEHVRQDNLRKHCLATEAIMRELAVRLGEDERLWAITGLLHDLDFETTRNDMSRHGIVSTTEYLGEDDLPDSGRHAIAAHNEKHTGVKKQSRLDFALSCAESVTGLIVATALVMPDRKLSSVKTKSVLKRMKKKDFARNVDRDEIRLCSKLGLELDDFVTLAVEAMSSVSDDLGL